MNPVIASFAESLYPVSIERSGIGSYENGEWVPGAKTTVEIDQAAVIPAKASDMRNLPEGKEGRGGIFVYSESEILALNKTNGIQPDVITWQERLWEVQWVDHLTQIPSLTHYMALALEVDA